MSEFVAIGFSFRGVEYRAEITRRGTVRKIRAVVMLNNKAKEHPVNAEDFSDDDYAAWLRDAMFTLTTQEGIA